MTHTPTNDSVMAAAIAGKITLNLVPTTTGLTTVTTISLTAAQTTWMIDLFADLITGETR